MHRRHESELDAWLADPARKPLILRGARQVGKTWLVRDLAARSGRDLIELNFERDPGLHRHFESNDPHRILGNLSLQVDRDTSPQDSLLFLDEIQAAPELLAKLRWFLEELPELPVIAAGSLLEFTLTEHDISMPVGRVTFRHVEPMSFSEYLIAHDRARLHDALAAWRPGDDLPSVAHEQAIEWFQRYSMVGGMPEVVAADVEGRAPRHVRERQSALMATYRADFAKYTGRMDRDVVDTTLLAVAGMIGQKFACSRVEEGIRHSSAKRALELLARARVCHLVDRSSANDVPLGAEATSRGQKAILGDVGMLHALVGTPAEDAFPAWSSLEASLRGRLADQLAGQQLRLRDTGPGDGARLYYWRREGGRAGEVDYVIQAGGRVVPLKLKGGTAGSMKSLHQFMFDRGLPVAVRSDLNPPSVMDVSVKTTQGDRAAYRLVGVPLYLLWNLDACLA